MEGVVSWCRGGEGELEEADLVEGLEEKSWCFALVVGIGKC